MYAGPDTSPPPLYRRDVAEAEIAALLASARRLDAETPDDPAERRRYIDYHLHRYAQTFRMAAAVVQPGTRVFSLGSAPNDIELLLMHYRGADVTGSAFRGSDTREHIKVEYELDGGYRYTTTVHLRDFARDMLPTPERPHDVVLAFEVLEHMMQSPRRLLSEARRVLRPGGLLLVTTPNAQFWPRILYAVKGRCYPDVDFHDQIEARHHHVFSLPELTGTIESVGFEISHTRYVDFWNNELEIRQISMSQPLNVVLKILMNRFGARAFRHDDMFVVARAPGAR
jgi:SAM-dependent methyltransferase